MHRRNFLRILPVSPAFAPRLAADSAAPLFDGQSLRGWTIADGPQSAFYVSDGAIIGSPASGYPAWLRSERRYENFDLEFDYFLQGWMDGGVYFHAPEHGTKSRCGIKVSLFHQVDKEPVTNSAGAIFPSVAPRTVNVRGKGEWNSMRVRMDWPRLDVWSNGEVIHSLNVEATGDLKYRLRDGYVGFETLSYPLRFRNIRVRELPSGTRWQILYDQPSDLGRWHITEPNDRFPARYDALGPVLRGDGLGNLTSNEKYRDFELQMYVRGALHHNGGVLFRSKGNRDWYEIQLHDVEESHYPTGSLYFFQRARYPRIAAEQWFLFQLVVKDRTCIVRIDGENVLEYDRLTKLDPGFIELQAHQAGRWIEYKQIRLRPL
jgi:hypothetical protein